MEYIEIKGDLETLKNDILTKKEKTALAEKYNAVSYKLSDINMAICQKLRELRSQKKDFQKSDISDFLCSPFKERTRLNEESIDFVRYYKEYAYGRIKNKSVIDCANSYNSTPTERYYISEYKKAVKIIEEADGINSKKEENINLIFIRLSELTEEFMDDYLIRVNKHFSDFYDSLENRISDLEKKISETENQSSNISYIKKLKSKLQTYKGISSTGKNEYVDKMTENAKRQFISDLKALSERFYDKNISPDFKIISFCNSQKYFDVILESNGVRYNGRAIVAAEYSEKVSTHLRYIITKIS